ncbi:MAG: polysaccharide pyruvyl transferase family protein [Actinomycetota bacterium]|nr:polysaccharide pyruvyl transferase family protein [Actinomycetota bacterium]
MKILLIGDVGGDEYHVGDEAVFQVALCELGALPAAQITVVAAQPARVAERHGVQAIAQLGFHTAPGAAGDDERELRLQQVLDGTATDAAAVAVRAAVEAADGVVVAGGGNMSAAWPHLLYERVALLSLAAEADVPAVVVGQTLGPRFTPRQRERLGEALAGAQLVGVCDEASLAVVHASPAADRAVLHVDDAVQLARTTDQRLPELPEQYLGLVLHHFLPDTEAMLAQLVRLVADLHRTSGLPVVLVPNTWPAPADAGAGGGAGADHCDRDGDGDGGSGDRESGHLTSSAANDDLTLAIRLAALVDDPGVALVAPTVDSCTTARVVRGASAIVSTRRHPIVLALAAGVPCMAVSTDGYTAAKLDGALAPAGLSGWRLPAAALATPAAAAMFADLWQRRELLGRHIAAATAAWPQLHAQRWQAVRATLAGDPAAPAALKALTVDGDAATLAVLAPGDPMFAALAAAEAAGHGQLLEVQRRFDTAEEYALSVRTALAARDTEIDGLREQALVLQRQHAAAQSTIARLEDELEHATLAADRARELVNTIDQHRTAELAAINNTRVMRWSRAPRSVYRRLRQALHR